MINVLIVDDEQHCIDILETLLQHYKNFKICGTAKSVDSAIKLTRSLRPDLVFLDISLGCQTGFDYLNTFKPNINFDIIFTTAYNVSAAKAFEYSALHYLLKPIGHDSFQNALLRMENKVNKLELLEQYNSLEHNMVSPGNEKMIHISTVEEHYKINSKEILFIKSDSNYSEFHFSNKKKIISSKTLKHYVTLLNDSHFYLANKSYLVNVNHIDFYRKKSRELVLNNGTTVAVAVRRQKDFVNNIFRG